MNPRSLAISLALVVAPACAKEPLLDPKMPAPTSEQEQATAPAVEEAPLPKGSIARSYVDHVLRQGPGWLLDKVPVEEVVTGGKFIGWRVRELPADWSSGELQPGDVVTALNGMAVETPNEFWAAWSSVAAASSLKVAFLRGKDARSMTLSIVGKADPAATAKLGAAQAPDAPPPAREKRFETVRIEGDPVSFSPPVDWTTD